MLPCPPQLDPPFLYLLPSLVFYCFAAFVCVVAGVKSPITIFITLFRLPYGELDNLPTTVTSGISKKPLISALYIWLYCTYLRCFELPVRNYTSVHILCYKKLNKNVFLWGVAWPGMVWGVRHGSSAWDKLCSYPSFGWSWLLLPQNTAWYLPHHLLSCRLQKRRQTQLLNSTSTG